MKLRTLILLAAFAACSDNPVTGTMKPKLSLERLVLDDQAYGPAFADVGDLNKDGKLDLVVSKFGTVNGVTLPFGEVTAYLQGDSILSWTAMPIVTQSEELIWPNDIKLADIDDDGDLDVFVPVGFLVCPFIGEGKPCGGLLWYEQKDGSWIRHEIVEPGNELFYHAVEFVDIDGDGIKDIVTVGEEQALASTGEGNDRAVAQWFKGNTSDLRFDKTPQIIGAGLGSIPTVMDIDKDGDLDVASAEYFAKMGASFTWFEQTSLGWVRHVIDDEVGPSIQLSFIRDFNKNTPLVAIGSNHTNTSKPSPDPWESALYLYEIPENPRDAWPKRKISQHIVSVPGRSSAPQAAPGIFGYGDVDNDGDQDLVVSGDGDPRVFLMEQDSSGDFVMHVLEEKLGQAGTMKIIDLDGDGKSEVVISGYEDNVLYIYRHAQNGTYPKGVAQPVDRSEPMLENLVIEVNYEGTKSGNLIAALFESYPPKGPPLKYKTVENAQFPASVDFGPGIDPGNYQALLYLDAAPYSAMQNGPEDPYVVAPVNMPMSAPMQVSLSESGGDTMPGMMKQPGSLEVTVNYAGMEKGDVVVAAFESLPPAGPPLSFKLVKAADFPATVLMENIPGGSVQVLAFLDLEPFNIMAPDAGDPQISSMPVEINGGKTEITVELTR